MKKSQSISKLGNGMTRTQVVLETEDCKTTDQTSRFLQFELLRAIADDASLTQCGTSYFDSLSVRHNGKCWVAVAEATTEDINAPKKPT